MPMTYMLRLFCLGVISILFTGCTLTDPILERDPIAAPKPQSMVVYRDLTVSWENRRYWSSHNRRSPKTDKPHITSSRATNNNAYLLGKYGSPNAAHHPVSIPRPIPPVTLPGSGPVSSPVAQTSTGDSYTNIAEADPQPLPRGLSYRIWFAKDRDTLGPQGKERVQRLAQNPDFNRAIWLRGHTLADEGGSDPDRFSVGRALSVRQQLQTSGFSHAARIKYRNPDQPGRYVEVTVQ